MNKGSTIFLKGVVILIGLIVLASCIFVLPPAISSDQTGDYRPILLGMYIPAIPFFIALYQTLKLLSYIDKNKAFSQASVNALKKVKYCALIISGLYAAGMPYVYMVADQDDAPGVILIGLVIIGTSLVIATSAAVLQKLLQNVIDIKSENDLTV
ncbi:MAG TPA: DUF2975 domain-containing protein [Candidatus Polarisedimenticolaceae bacterium]|nr:DUF2975 domain-containing protein [Candidatus Polarisedimenticolaceae bacterium]